MTGIGLTTFAFINAYRALRRGDSQQANRMFRARVAAQGFTVFAMLAGSMYYSQDREKTKELRQLKEQRENEEKRQKWIRELEVRDEEEKALREKMQKMTQAAQAKREEAEQGVNQSGQEKEGSGILNKVGLWPKGQEEADKDDKTNAEDPEQAGSAKKSRNPKSSLGDLGEVISSQKKDR